YSELFSGEVTAGEINASRIKLNGVDLLDLIGSGSGVLGAQSSLMPTEYDIEENEALLCDIRDHKEQVAVLNTEFASLASLVGELNTTNELLGKILSNHIYASGHNVAYESGIDSSLATNTLGSLNVSGRAVFNEVEVNTIMIGKLS